jgi:hypothetical protein
MHISIATAWHGHAVAASSLMSRSPTPQRFCSPVRPHRLSRKNSASERRPCEEPSEAAVQHKRVCQDDVVGAFENSFETWARPDWRLLQNGFVSLFKAPDRFAEAKLELTELGYHVLELDAAGWDTTEAALLSFGSVFDFPDYYGKNINALADCLRDVATLDYGSDPASEGTVVAIDRIDALHARDPDLAWTLLDILADTGRQALLIGHRFIVIARSDDPRLDIKPVGACPVGWNSKERLNKPAATNCIAVRRVGAQIASPSRLTGSRNPGYSERPSARISDARSWVR